MPTHLRLQVNLEIAALAMVDNLLVILLVATTLAHHHSVLMLIVRKWHLCLVLLEAVVLEEALEVDLVEVTLIHIHMLVVETKRNPRHSP